MRLGLVELNGGNRAAVASLLCSVLCSFRNFFLDSVCQAVITDSKYLRAGAFAKTATDSILRNCCFHSTILSLIPKPLTW